MNSFKLENGLTVLINNYPGQSTGIDFCFNFGSVYEKDREAGIAHFLEHLFFSASKMGKKKPFQLVESAGGELNAFTSKEETHYYSRIRSVDIGKPIKVFSDCFNEGQFKEEDVELEKKIILNEIREARDNPVKRLFDEFTEDCMGKTFGRRTIGSEKTVSAITPKNLENCMKKNYFNKNAIIGISSSLTQKEALKESEGKFTERKGSKEKIKGKQAKAKKKQRIIRGKTEQAHCCLGFPVINAHHKDYIILQLIEDYLGGGLSSRLPQEIREKRGLSYAVSSFIDCQKNHGMFGIYFSTSENKMEKAKKLAVKELERIQERKLSSAELKRTKSRFLGQKAIENENSFRAAKDLVDTKIYGSPEPVELEQKIKQITTKEILDAARTHLQSKNYTFTALAPNK